MIMSSPMRAPDGMPASHIPASSAAAKAMRMFSRVKKSRWHTAKRKAILRIADRLDPSMWIVAPIGTIVSRMSRGTPIFSPTRRFAGIAATEDDRSEEHTSELQSRFDLVCRLLLEKKNKNNYNRKLIKN